MLTKTLHRYGFITAILMLFYSPMPAAEPTAAEIMRNNFFATKAGSLVTDATMELVNNKGQLRERNIVTFSKLQDDGVNLNVVVRFNTPADVRGTTFLQIQNSEEDDHMWIYLPALKKTRRLVANNKRDSFVGTDFSFGDILTLKPDLFNHALVRTEPLDGHACYVIESVPKDEKLTDDIGYSKKTSWIRKDNFMEAKVEYYDERGQLYKTQTTADHKLLEAAPQRWIAMRREMLDHQSQHKTIVIVNKTDTGSAIPDSRFTTRSIEYD